VSGGSGRASVARARGRGGGAGAGGAGAGRGIDELRASVAAVLAREQVPGAGIALVEGGRIVWAGGVGVADRATGRPITEDTVFRVASISKSFVALAIVKLAEQGRLDLRARVSDLAPELAIGNRWAATQPITVAHLLEHTAGFDDMRPNETFGPVAIEAMPLAEVLARNPASRVARWRPGSRFSYANPGYTVAGYVIEKVTGRRYEDVVAREIFSPLGMTGAALRWTPELDARLARGYDEGDAPLAYHAIYHRPAGNLMASAREVAAVVELALARGQVGGVALISPGGMARIERSETAEVSPDDASYGLGNYGDVSERVVLRGHNGSLPGFLSSYGYAPGRGIGYVLLLNSTRSGRALEEVRHLLVEYLLAGSPVPPPPRRVVVPQAELVRWAGTYHLAAPRHQLFAFVERLVPDFELFVEGGGLYFRGLRSSSAPIELIPLGGDRFRLEQASGSHVVLARDREGRRIVVAGGAYLVEEPRATALAFAIIPGVCLRLLATGLLLPLWAFRRRRRSPGLGWRLCTAVSLFAIPIVAAVADAAIWQAEPNGYTVGICVLTLTFAVGSAGSAVEALAWLPRPGSVISKLYRLAFAAAACLTTAYLAAYGIIGIRLWSW
jgi:CubicO group peptidase (beta-lactamase class C family)